MKEHKVAALAVLENPFAGRFVEDLTPLIDAGEELGALLAKRATEALGAQGESYGKAAIVGEAGELEQNRELTASLDIDADRMRVALDLPPGKARATTISARVSLPRLYTSAEAKADNPDFGTIPDFLAADATGHVDATLRFRSLALLRPLLSRIEGLEMDGEGWMIASIHFEHGRYLGEKSSLR